MAVVEAGHRDADVRPRKAVPGECGSGRAQGDGQGPAREAWQVARPEQGPAAQPGRARRADRALTGRQGRDSLRSHLVPVTLAEKHAQRPGEPDYSGLTPANFTTLPHFSVSSTTSLPSSPGLIANGSPPSWAMRTFILGSASPARTSSLMVATTSAGVFLGAPSAYHWLASNPGRVSATSGTSGSASSPANVVTANARTLPALMYSIAAGTVEKISCTWSPIRSASAGASPR